MTLVLLWESFSTFFVYACWVWIKPSLRILCGTNDLFLKYYMFFKSLDILRTRKLAFYILQMANSVVTDCFVTDLSRINWQKRMWLKEFPLNCILIELIVSDISGIFLVLCRFWNFCMNKFRSAWMIFKYLRCFRSSYGSFSSNSQFFFENVICHHFFSSYILMIDWNQVFPFKNLSFSIETSHPYANFEIYFNRITGKDPTIRVEFKKCHFIFENSTSNVTFILDCLA